jgi:O-antigen/teichoic acid export membrane protein
MSRTRRYLMGLGSGYVVTFATILVGLWLTPFTLRILDREQFAIFTLANDILMWLGLLDLGITAGLNVQAAQLTGRPDEEKLNRLASTAFFTQLCISGLTLVVGMLVTLAFPYFFQLPKNLQADAVLLMALMVLGTVISMGTRTFSALLVAHQQVHIDNLIRLGLVVVRTALTVILLVSGFGLLSLAWANLAATCVMSTFAVVRLFRFLPRLHLRREFFSWNVLRETGGLGIWFSFGMLAGLFIENMDRILAAKLVTLESVTILSLTGRVYALSYGLIQQVSNTARPMLGQMLGEGKKDEVFLRYKQLFALSTGSAVVVAASLWAGNGNFVAWWVGSVNYGGPLLDVALSLNLIVNLWVLPNRAVLSSGMVVKPQALGRLAEGGLNLILAIVLSYKLGLVGVVISTACAGLLTSFWFLPFLTARMLSRSFTEVFTANIVQVGLLFVIMVPLSVIARYVHWGNVGLLSVVFPMTFVGVIGAACFWFFVLDSQIRVAVKNGHY